MKKIFGMFIMVAALFAGSMSVAGAEEAPEASSVSACVYDLLDGEDEGVCNLINFTAEDILYEDYKVIGADRYQGSDGVWREQNLYDNRFVLSEVAAHPKLPTIVVLTQWVGNSTLHQDIHFAWDQMNDRVWSEDDYVLAKKHEFVATATVTRMKGPEAPIFIVELTMKEMRTTY